jgi:acyl carrier protein
MNMASIETQLVEYLRGVTSRPELTVETELVESGIADSLTMMDLLVFIETELKVRLENSDLNADSFRSPATLAGLIAARLGAPRRGEAA